MKWHQQATLVDWKKKLRSIKYIHFYRQNYSNTPCRLKKQVVLAMCPYKIKLCSLLYPKFSQSLVSCWVSAFLILPFYFSSSSHTLSFISLQGWKFFTFPSLSSIPVTCFPLSLFTFLSVSLSPLIRPYMNFAASNVV